MNITVLTDNFAGPYFLAEHGLSFLIEFNDNKTLLDVGATDVFLKNAQKLNISIDEVKNIVLSHGHWDHGNGLKFLKNKNLITHPNSFIKRYRRSNNEYLGLNRNFDQLNQRFNIFRSIEPLEISKNMIFLGEIERKFDFEKWKTPYIEQSGDDDYIRDDSAIAIIDNSELVLIAGCSHSGICNIVEYAKKVTGVSKVKAVLGGFHLKNINDRTLKTINYLKKLDLKYLYPSHCTQFPVLAEFYNHFKIKQLKTGMKIHIH